MPPRVRQLAIGFGSPFRVGSGLGCTPDLDHTAVRDADGLPYIPASMLKGRVRSLCKKVALTLADTTPAYEGICDTLHSSEGCKPFPGRSPCIICRMFGSRFFEGALRFTDGLLSEEVRNELRLRRSICPGKLDFELHQPRAQVGINRRRGVAQAKILFRGETLPETLSFTARIIGELGETEEQLLAWGVNLLTHLGAQKSRGLGQCRLSLM